MSEAMTEGKKRMIQSDNFINTVQPIRSAYEKEIERLKDEIGKYQVDILVLKGEVRVLQETILDLAYNLGGYLGKRAAEAKALIEAHSSGGQGQ